MQHNQCRGLDAAQAAELVERLLAEPWLCTALDAVMASGLPHAWIGAGAVRDVVWGQLGVGFEPSSVRDVDVAFYDASDLRPELDDHAQRRLAMLAHLPWEATNQAAVHTWYHEYFGGAPVSAFRCVHDAVATWPETATCVAVRRSSDGRISARRTDWPTCLAASGAATRPGCLSRRPEPGWPAIVSAGRSLT